MKRFTLTNTDWVDGEAARIFYAVKVMNPKVKDGVKLKRLALKILNRK